MNACNPCNSGMHKTRYYHCSCYTSLAMASIGLSNDDNHAMQAIYVTYNPDGDVLKLPYCIILFGGFQFIMSQLPDMHSLRFMNAISNVMTLTFCAIAVGMSVHNGEMQLFVQHLAEPDLPFVLCMPL